jgi:hypothetical protein
MFGKIKSAVQAVAGAASDAVGAGFEKLKAPLDELSAVSPELERVGYTVREIELVAALLPRIVIHFTRGTPAGEEAYQALLANHPNNGTLGTVVGLLRQADRLLVKVELKGRRCTGLAVELGIPPCLRMMYTADARSATV